MEPTEYFAGSRHIRQNLPVAVEAIESGESVCFTYVVAEAVCNHADPSWCGEDHLVGWLLVATLEWPGDEPGSTGNSTDHQPG